VRILPVIFNISVKEDSPIIGRTTKEEIIDKNAKPRINFGNLYQIWIRLGFSFDVLSIFVTQRNATTKAIRAIITFWMSFITVATSIACSPSSSPAATTAPVESTVPPIHAPPTTKSIPRILIKAGKPTRSITVDNREIDIVNVSNSFLALVAAATAMAAETPQTEVAAAINTLSEFYPILKPMFHICT